MKGTEEEIGACLSSERLAVTDLLQVVEPAGDAPVAGAVERVEGDAGASVDAAVHLRAGEDRIQVGIHDARGGDIPVALCRSRFRNLPAEPREARERQIKTG